MCLLPPQNWGQNLHVTCLLRKLQQFHRLYHQVIPSRIKINEPGNYRNNTLHSNLIYLRHITVSIYLFILTVTITKTQKYKYIYTVIPTKLTLTNKILAGGPIHLHTFTVS